MSLRGYFDTRWPERICKREGHRLVSTPMDTGMCWASTYHCEVCGGHTEYFAMKDAGWQEGMEYQVVRHNYPPAYLREFPQAAERAAARTRGVK